MVRCSALLICLSIMGCAPLANAPSLAPRPAETADPVVTAAPVSLPKCIDPGHITRIEVINGLAGASDYRFYNLMKRARTSAPTGSDAWIEAQNTRSLAVLEHSATASVIEMFDAEISKHIETCDVSEYRAAQAEVQAMVDRQTTELSR